MTRTLGLFLLISCCEAAVKVPSIIGDHMLLQRDAPVRIFGTAAPGEAVSVAYRGQTARAVASSWGRWEAGLAPMGLGAAGEMTIRASNTIQIADVLVGDVWVGSGQSNMQFAVRQTNNAEAEMAGATFPEIRLFAVPRKGSAVPV